MRTISYRLEDLKKVTIHIGYVGENEHTRVNIDAGEVFAENPDAVVTMKVQPPRGEVYPVTVSREGDIVTWDVKDSDLVSRGAGEIQLTFTEGTEVIKSCIARISIDRSIVGNGTAPDPVQDWVDSANEKLAAVEEATTDAETAAGKIDDMTVAASGSAYGSDPTATITEVEGHKHVAFTIPAGQPGTPGDPTQLIDDTAGSGTTGKTWSADKINTEVSQVKTDITKDEADIESILDHETYEKSLDPIVEYDPVTPDTTVSGAQLLINAYGTANISTPSGADVKIFPVVNGKTYKVIGRCTTTKPLLVVADSVVTSGAIGLKGSYDYQYGTHADHTVEEQEYTALRTGYLYITSSSSDCGLWLKKTTTPTITKYHIDDVVSDVSEIKSSMTKTDIIRTKADSTTAMVKNVPRNAEQTAMVTSLASTVTLVRSIIGRNLINKNAVGDVAVDASGTLKVGMKTVHVPPGAYYCILGNVGNYTMVKKVENGIYTTLYKDQFPMKLSITDPAGGYFIVYASSLANLGDVSGVMIGRLMDDENTLSYEAYSEKTYTREAIGADNRIEVRPYGFVEFVNPSGADVASTIVYTVIGKDDDTTTRKDFIVSPDGSKFLPIVKNDGSIVCTRVVPKKALFIGNSLTSGWQTFGEAATDSDNDFVAFFSSVVEDMESNYTFNRKWATQFEQQTSLANAQSWVTTNIDPLLSSDLDLIVVQLCENVVENASAVATFPESSLWLMQHLRTECPKARVIWMGLWFERRWAKTLLENTAKAGVEYIDIRPLYVPENVSVIGTVYEMDSDYTKSYDVDSFVVSNGTIALTFTVDGKQYTATIPSYTSYTSSGDTQISVTGIYHVVNTYYASIHPGDEGFRKIANKMLFDLGISDSEEAIPAST